MSEIDLPLLAHIALGVMLGTLAARFIWNFADDVYFAVMNFMHRKTDRSFFAVRRKP